MNVNIHRVSVLRTTVVIMDRRGREDTFEQRQLVILHHDKGKSCPKIADMLQIKGSTVYDIMKIFRVGDGTDNIRPRMFSVKRH